MLTMEGARKLIYSKRFYCLRLDIIFHFLLLLNNRNEGGTQLNNGLIAYDTVNV